jgi:hypothetical protein
MALYKERGVNPAAGCLPLLVQMPILFGMYSAMLQLSTQGLTLDQVQNRTIESGRIVYQAVRTEVPLPFNQWIVTDLKVVPTGSGPVILEIVRESSTVSLKGENRLDVGSVSGPLTLTPGQTPSNPGFPTVANGKAGLSLHPGGTRLDDGTLNRNVPVEAGKPFIVEVNVSAPQTHTDAASFVVTWDPATATVSEIDTRPVVDVPFKSAFLWLPSLGEYDVFNIAGLPLPIPGLLLILMTITTFLTTRMTAMPVEDPQQQAMMRTMAFMPLMYLFFFSQTPAGLVLYWLISNVFTMFQQFFTTGLGLLAGDIKRFTGRDLQPAWASLPGPAMPLRNGTSSISSSDDERTPATEQRETANARRSRASSASKGRTRGKR